MTRTKELFANLLLPAHSDLIGIAYLFQSGRTKLNLQVPVVVPSHPVVGAEPVYVQLLLHPFEHVKCLARQVMSRMVIPEVTPSLPTGSHVLRVLILTSGTLPQTIGFFRYPIYIYLCRFDAVRAPFSLSCQLRTAFYRSILLNCS